MTDTHSPRSKSKPAAQPLNRVVLVATLIALGICAGPTACGGNTHDQGPPDSNARDGWSQDGSVPTPTSGTRAGFPRDGADGGFSRSGADGGFTAGRDGAVTAGRDGILWVNDGFIMNGGTWTDDGGHSDGATLDGADGRGSDGSDGWTHLDGSSDGWYSDGACGSLDGFGQDGSDWTSDGAGDGNDWSSDGAADGSG